MLNPIDARDLPRALQHLLERDGPSDPANEPPRRSFLKLAGASGLALGAFPALLVAQSAGAALKPTQQPLAFVQIAPNGEVTVTVRLSAWVARRKSDSW